jgi:hypothetical protein
MKKTNEKRRKNLVENPTPKKLESLKEKIIRLTSLVEQALKSRSGEATST